MRLALLARNPNLYSHQRLVEAAQARGHDIDVINTLHVHMNITSSQPMLRYGGRTLPLYDAVIPRIGASITHYGLAVLRQFEMQGVFPLNESVAIGRSRDKLRALQILAREGIGLPVTAFAHGPRNAEDVIKEVGGAPCVIKLLEGTQGMRRHPGGDASARPSRSSRPSARPTSTSWCRSSSGRPAASDIRALVIGGKVVASMKRSGKTGEFRANLHRGGKAEAVAITEERQTAVRSAAALGLNVCGVDMLRSNRGPLVMEVNSSPGFRGDGGGDGGRRCQGIIEFLAAHARYGETETRGNG